MPQIYLSLLLLCHPPHRGLSCQRITLHKNLFCSYVLNSALTIIYLVAVVNNPEVVSRNPVSSVSSFRPVLFCSLRLGISTLTTNLIGCP